MNQCPFIYSCCPQPWSLVLAVFRCKTLQQDHLEGEYNTDEGQDEVLCDHKASETRESNWGWSHHLF